MKRPQHDECPLCGTTFLNVIWRNASRDLERSLKQKGAVFVPENLEPRAFRGVLYWRCLVCGHLFEHQERWR